MPSLARSAAALLALAVLASCQPAGKVQARRKAAQGAGESAPATGQSDLTLTFTDQAFQNYKVGTTDLTYVFKYQGAKLNGPIVFQGNQGTLNFTSLPTNIPGEIRLEVYASSALKMAGVQSNVTLKAGPNQIALTNFIVDGIDINSGWDGKSFQGNHVWKLEGL